MAWGRGFGMEAGIGWGRGCGKGVGPKMAGMATLWGRGHGRGAGLRPRGGNEGGGGA